MTEDSCTECVDYEKYFEKSSTTEISNPPGLSKIDYRIGTYSDFRRKIFENLNNNQTLSNWTYRFSDDPGIALLEGASILGDILTFYQDIYANEAFLKTAKQRKNVAELVRMLGYRLSPGLGGNGTFAFVVDGKNPILVPHGFQVKADLENDPAYFESINDTIAYPWLSKFSLFRPLENRLISNATKEFQFNLDENDELVDLHEGDRLIVGEPEDVNNPSSNGYLNNTEIVIIDSIRTIHGKKIFKIRGSLKLDRNSSSIQAYKIKNSFNHFGHISPSTVLDTFADPPKPEIVDFDRNFQSESAQIGWDTSTLPLYSNVFPLDHRDESFSNGELVIFEQTFPFVNLIQKTFYQIRSISNIENGTVTLGAISEETTVPSGAISEETTVPSGAISEETTVTLGAISGETTAISTNDELLIPYHGTTYDIRNMQIHQIERKPFVIEAIGEETSQLTDRELFYYGTFDDAIVLKDRNIIFNDNETSFQRKVVNVLPTDDLSIQKIILDLKVGYSKFPHIEEPPISVYGNLVVTNQGKTETELVLGNGDNREKFQTFQIPKSPLTYHRSNGDSPPEQPELLVYVNDILWHKVPTLYNSKPKDSVYIVRQDDDGENFIQFGDGKTGSRLPSGIKNIVAKIRTGIGAFGPIKKDSKIQALSKLDDLDEILLFHPISGGEEPESAERARRAAPVKVQALNRLVSLQDYENLVLGLPGVTKSQARWKLVEGTPKLVITVLMKTGREQEILDIKEEIFELERCYGTQRFPIEINQAFNQYVYVDAEISINPNLKKEFVLQQIKQTLGILGNEEVDGNKGLFGLNERNIAEDEYKTSIAGKIQSVDGVLWAKIKSFGTLTGSENPIELQVPQTKELNDKIVCDSTHILRLHNLHLTLPEVSPPIATRCDQ